MDTNATLIESAYAAFGRGDVPAIIDLVDDSVVWNAPRTLPQGGSFDGKAGVGAFFQGIGAGWGDLAVKVESLSEAGSDQVVAVVQAEGTLQSGSAGSYGATHLFTLRDGKIVRFQEYTDLDAPLS